MSSVNRAGKGDRNFIYTTTHEVKFIKDIYCRNRAAFLHCAEMIIQGRKTYMGDGMRVKLSTIRNLVYDLMAKHHREFPSGYPPPKRKEGIN
jgi:hypothetical protein